MQRDGFNESLWQTGIPEYTPRTADLPAEPFDVVIVGGGITGITTAYRLQQAGLRCLVAESRNLCFGTSGGTTAHLNNFFDSTYAQVQQDFGADGARLLAAAANDALELYAHHVTDLNLDCDYVRNKGFLFALDEKQSGQLDDIFNATRDAGLAIGRAQNIPVPIPFTAAVVYEGQAQIHPVKYVYGLARAFEAAGGVIRTGCRVTGVEAGEVLQIHTGAGDIGARHLVYATHIPPGVNVLHFRCSPWRSYVLACTLDDDDYPANPAYDMSDPYRYYRTQEIGGRRYLIAGGEDHAAGKESDTEVPFQRLEEYLRKYFRIRSVDKKWSSQYFDPADGLAYIGHLPGSGKNVFVASGFAGNGMTWSHIAATVLTGLIQGKETALSAMVSPGRLKPVAALGSELKAGLQVATSFIGDRLKVKKIVDEAAVPAGEARVIKHEGDNLGVYHDEHGKFHTINATCTHLKCLVAWNGTERSWDCPCHGARYGIDGEMITGPADRDLEKETPLF